MSRVSDRVKQRREYSKQKREIYVAAVCFLAPFIFLLVSLCFDLSAMDCSNGADDGSRPLDFTAIIMINLLLTSVVLFEARNEISNLPYVPPVTADTLPGDEVLLRGSEKPPIMQSDVLLRAAKSDFQRAKRKPAQPRSKDS